MQNKMFTGSDGQNILRIFDIWPNFYCTSSETNVIISN